MDRGFGRHPGSDLMDTVRDFYAERCRLYQSCGWMAAHWFSQEDQDARFEIVKKYLERSDSILDVGCGQGDILRHISSTEYLGIDITPEMIQLARVKFPTHRFQVADILSFEGRPFHTAVAVGSFGLRLEDSDNYIYFQRAVNSMLKHARNCIIVVPRTGSSLNIPYVFHYDPDRIAGLVSSACRTFSIDARSLEHEMIVHANRFGTEV